MARVQPRYYPSKVAFERARYRENLERFKRRASPDVRYRVRVFDRIGNLQRKRIVWDEHIRSVSDRSFQRAYRVDKPTFSCLADAIREDVQVNEHFAILSSGEPISVEIRLACALRWLAGGSYIDISWAHGVAEHSFYQIIWPVIDAINENLHLHFPIDDDEALCGIADGFKRRANNPLWGCVGALDGLAIKIKQPTTKSCKDVRSYYNRKGFFAVILEAVVDSNYKFLFGSSRCCGSTHDSVAWGITSLARAIAEGKLRYPFFLVGDDAYSCCNSLVTPWPGKNLPLYKDAYNFWTSSSRTCSEQAFGILVARWGILWKPLSCDYHKVPKVVMCLLKLHNLCIDRNCPAPLRALSGDREGSSMELNLQGDCDLDLLQRRRRRDTESSNTRQRLTNSLEEAGRRRPRRAH
eukprot:Lithocolla_globosa_v1_NODE_1377_length_2621_cov_9.489478.p1 type:complete len:410 gc:universal NODE_1377_length_2621_cov_9.489478:1368-139(-)